MREGAFLSTLACANLNTCAAGQSLGLALENEGQGQGVGEERSDPGLFSRHLAEVNFEQLGVAACRAQAASCDVTALYVSTSLIPTEPYSEALAVPTLLVLFLLVLVLVFFLEQPLC